MWLKGLCEESGWAVGETVCEPELAGLEGGAGDSQRKGDTGDQGNVAEIEGLGWMFHYGETEEENSAALCVCVCV